MSPKSATAALVRRVSRRLRLFPAEGAALQKAEDCFGLEGWFGVRKLRLKCG